MNSQTNIDKMVQKNLKKNTIVAFVDLLGFTKDLESSWPQNAELFITRILSIKQSFLIKRDEDKFHTFTEWDKITVIAKPIYPEYITISDAFILCKQVESDSADEFLLSLLSVVASIYELWEMAIKGGFTLRGGISIGDVYFTATEIIGPSYIDAYLVESKIANDSRIVFHKSIDKKLRAMISTISPTLLEYCKMWFKIDYDNLIIANPITAFGADNPEKIDEVIQDLKILQEKAGEKHKKKYESLLSYLTGPKFDFTDLNKHRPLEVW